MIIEDLTKEINVLRHRLVGANRAERRVLREEINKLVAEREEIKSMYEVGRR